MKPAYVITDDANTPRITAAAGINSQPKQRMPGITDQATGKNIQLEGRMPVITVQSTNITTGAGKQMNFPKRYIRGIHVSKDIPSAQ